MSLFFDGQEVVVARAKPLLRSSKHSLHIKILKSESSVFKGKGLGALLAIVFAYHCYSEFGWRLVSSRSNSWDALFLWRKLVVWRVAENPIEGGDEHLLNQKLRQEKGLPDKFDPANGLIRKVIRSKYRYRVTPTGLLRQQSVIEFYKRTLRTSSVREAQDLPS